MAARRILKFPSHWPSQGRTVSSLQLPVSGATVYFWRKPGRCSAELHRQTIL